MLPAIGLTLDLIGAAVLAYGLFRYPRALRWDGWTYSPKDATRDQAFGITGGLLLAIGFVGQALPSFGVSLDASAYRTLMVAGLTFAVGLVGAVAVYSLSLHLAYPAKRRRAEQESPDHGYPYSIVLRPRAWRPRLLAFVKEGTGEVEE